MYATHVSTFAQCVGTLPALVTRLDSQCVLDRWRAAEPVFTTARSVADLREWTQPEADRARAREVIAALVRLGSVDQPDGQPGDQDAVVTAIHLLRPAITRRARRCSPDSDETMRMLISELALVIQTFPWRTSTPTPGRLVLDAWHQAWYGQASADARFRQHVATTDDTERLLGSATPETPACVELVDVLTCAAADGVLTDDDVRLLWLVVHHGGIGIPGEGATAAVAKVLSVSARTVRRRYRRAVDKLTASYRKAGKEVTTDGHQRP